MSYSFCSYQVHFKFQILLTCLNLNSIQTLSHYNLSCGAPIHLIPFANERLWHMLYVQQHVCCFPITLTLIRIISNISL